MNLEGVKVIDFSQYIPGSYTSQRLAEMGAEVIKVEPLNGDVVRRFGREKESEGVVFAAQNRHKKSVTINLRERNGQELAMDLIQQADVVLESFRPGTMKKYNLDYQSVQKTKKDIIYLSLTGYGQEGMLSNYGSHDLNYQALSGLLSQLVEDGGRPILPKVTFADILGGLGASERILSALFHRERTGKGQYIDLALMDEVASTTRLKAFTYSMVEKENVISQLDGELISYNIYETEDRRYVALAALEPKFWKAFCEVIGKPEWISYHLTTKGPNNPVYLQLKDLFLTKTLEEWQALSLTRDLCLTPILHIEELQKHPYFLEKNLVNFSGAAPELGEHNEQVLRKILNKTNEEIQILKEKGVI